jgi:ribose transport system permease protein
MAWAAPVFVGWPNINVLLSNMAFESIALGGMTLLLVARLFDLSLDGAVAMAGVILGKFIMAGIPWPLAIALSLGMGLLMGLANGVLVMRLKINALIGTLATGWIMAGVAFGLTSGMSGYGFPHIFQLLGQARVLGIRIFVWYAVVIIGALALLLARTKLGRHIYIMGGNPDAGRLFGVQVDKIGVQLYALMGLLAALIGVVLAARMDAASPDVADGMTMRVIAAAVIGGCSLSGGKGVVLTGILGLLLLNMMTNAAIILGLNPYWQKGIIGGVLLLALLLDASSGKIHVPMWHKCPSDGHKEMER